MFRDILLAALPTVGIPLLMFIWGIILSRERTVIAGYSLMAFIGLFFRQKLGLASGKVVNERIGTTMDDLTFGMRLWLQGKDKPTVAELKARAKSINP